MIVKTLQVLGKLKWRSFAFLAMTSLAVFWGCGRSEVLPGSHTDEGLPPEAIAVRTAFESASPSKKGPVEEMLRLVQAGSTNPSAYAEVLPQLEKLAGNPTLSAEQKQAVEALIQKLRSELSAAQR